MHKTSSQRSERNEEYKEGINSQARHPAYPCLSSIGPISLLEEIILLSVQNYGVNQILFAHNYFLTNDMQHITYSQLCYE
jgi:hypothetical protein